jgi:hypothetical protein
MSVGTQNYIDLAQEIMTGVRDFSAPPTGHASPPAPETSFTADPE